MEMAAETNQQISEFSIETLRVAFIGNVDSGKSSLIGTLMKGELDNGRGLARQAIFKHRHEAESGRTSSISTAYIGFSDEGDQVLSKRTGHCLSWEELATKSARNIQLIDLAGHEKYLKTTVFGLTGMQPHFVVVVVGANMGVKKMTREHLGIALALEIPVVIALTKIDIAPKNIAKETMRAIRTALRKASKMPLLVKDLAQAKTAANSIPSNRITPILPISNVTGDGLDNLRRMLSLVCPQTLKTSLMFESLKNSISNNSEEIFEMPAEVLIDENYQVPGVGFILAGTVNVGKIAINDVLDLGPDFNGKFHSVSIRSIQSMHIPLKEVVAGQAASFSIRSLTKKLAFNRNNFRKGMVLVSPLIDKKERVSRTFEAHVLILHHQTTVSIGYQPVINCRTIRQSAEIIHIEGSHGPSTIRTGDKAVIRFRFIKFAEFLKPNSRFIFRDGQAKGIGKIIRILPDE